MAEDALSDLLRTVRLTGAAFFDVAASDKWAIESPARELILPKVLPGANHLVAYHVVTAGHCFATPHGGAPVALETGQVVVFTDAHSHVMSSHPGLPGTPTTAALFGGPLQMGAGIRHALTDVMRCRCHAFGRSCHLTL